MRRISLLVSTFIGIIGLVFYFITIPTVNENQLVEVTAEAGDEQLLEDIYFSGYIPNYGEIYVNDEGVIGPGSLSYLEELDAPHDFRLAKLQEEYPEIIDSLIYDFNIHQYNVLNDDDFLLSTGVRYHDGNYDIQFDKLYLNLLNKDTNKMDEDIITRENPPTGDYTSITGLYLDYPKLTIVYLTNTFDENTWSETTINSIGKYNFETKNYSEERVPDEIEGFHGDGEASENTEAQLFHSNTFGDSTGKTYYYNYSIGDFVPLDSEDGLYMIGDDSQLYALDHDVENEQTLLKHYDETGKTIEDEVLLSHPIELSFAGENFDHLIEMIDGKLHVIKNQYSTDPTTKPEPSSYQVFDIETGEQLFKGNIHLDPLSEISAREFHINRLGKVSE